MCACMHMCVRAQNTSSPGGLTLSATKRKRLLGYFHPQLRTTHSLGSNLSGASELASGRDSGLTARGPLTVQCWPLGGSLPGLREEFMAASLWLAPRPHLTHDLKVLWSTNASYRWHHCQGAFGSSRLAQRFALGRGMLYASIHG